MASNAIRHRPQYLTSINSENQGYNGPNIKNKHEFPNVITGRNEVVAKVMFLHVSVILLTGRVYREPPWDQADTTTHHPPPWQGEPPPPTRQTLPPAGRTPLDQADTTTPPSRENPPRPGRPPLAGRTPPAGRNPPPPGTKEKPPRDQANPPRDQADTPPEEDCSIRSMSGRYASYWNAFLLRKWFHSANSGPHNKHCFHSSLFRNVKLYDSEIGLRLRISSSY